MRSFFRCIKLLKKKAIKRGAQRMDKVTGRIFKKHRFLQIHTHTSNSMINMTALMENKVIFLNYS